MKNIFKLAEETLEKLERIRNGLSVSSNSGNQSIKHSLISFSSGCGGGCKGSCKCSWMK